MPTLSEQWDEIATATMNKAYRDVGVKPGDHHGYLIARGFLSESPDHLLMLRETSPYTFVASWLHENGLL